MGYVGSPVRYLHATFQLNVFNTFRDVVQKSPDFGVLTKKSGYIYDPYIYTKGWMAPRDVRCRDITAKYPHAKFQFNAPSSFCDIIRKHPKI